MLRREARVNPLTRPVNTLWQEHAFRMRPLLSNVLAKDISLAPECASMGITVQDQIGRGTKVAVHLAQWSPSGYPQVVLKCLHAHVHTQPPGAFLLAACPPGPPKSRHAARSSTNESALGGTMHAVLNGVSSDIYGVCRAQLPSQTNKGQCGAMELNGRLRTALCRIEERGFGRFLTLHELKLRLTPRERARLAVKLGHVFSELSSRNLTLTDPVSTQFCTDATLRRVWVCDAEQLAPIGVQPAIHNAHMAPEYYEDSKGAGSCPRQVCRVRRGPITSHGGDIFVLGSFLTNLLLTPEITRFPMSLGPESFICPMSSTGRCVKMSDICSQNAQHEFGCRELNYTEPACLHESAWRTQDVLHRWAASHPRLSYLLRRCCSIDPLARPAIHEVVRNLTSRAVLTAELADNDDAPWTEPSRRSAAVEYLGVGRTATARPSMARRLTQEARRRGRTTVSDTSRTALAWLRSWQREHRGTPQYHPPTLSADAAAQLPPSRIPRLIVMTVASVNESLTNFGHLMSEWWTRNPEYAYVLLSDLDCQSFLAACCPRDERVAYSLLRQGAPRADLFRAIFMRDVGGIYVDQDSVLKRPLRWVLPTSAPAVTHRSDKSLNDAKVGWNFNFLAFEPGSPVWRTQVQKVVAKIFEQAIYSCHRDRRGCKGFYACVQNVTGSRSYLETVRQVTQRHGCASIQDCSGSSHAQLSGLVVLGDEDLPLSHMPCHAKGRHPCHRPKESQSHYVSLPAASVRYYLTDAGRRDGSSAPAYFHPLCNNSTSGAHTLVG